MIFEVYKKDGIEIIFEIDKLSKYYLDENGAIKQIDKNSLLKEWQLCKEAKIKGSFLEKFKAITEVEVLYYQRKLDKEIDYLYKKNKHLDFKCNAFRDALLIIK